MIKYFIIFFSFSGIFSNSDNLFSHYGQHKPNPIQTPNQQVENLNQNKANFQSPFPFTRPSVRLVFNNPQMNQVSPHSLNTNPQVEFNRSPSPTNRINPIIPIPNQIQMIPPKEDFKTVSNPQIDKQIDLNLKQELVPEKRKGIRIVQNMKDNLQDHRQVSLDQKQPLKVRENRNEISNQPFDPKKEKNQPQNKSPLTQPKNNSVDRPIANLQVVQKQPVVDQKRPIDPQPNKPPLPNPGISRGQILHAIRDPNSINVPPPLKLDNGVNQNLKPTNLAPPQKTIANKSGSLFIGTKDSEGYYDTIKNPSRDQKENYDQTVYALITIEGVPALVDKDRIRGNKPKISKTKPNIIFDFDEKNYDKENYVMIQDGEGKKMLILKSLHEAQKEQQVHENEPKRFREKGNDVMSENLLFILKNKQKSTGVPFNAEPKDKFRLQIHWEDSFLRATLRQLKRENMLKYITELVTRSEAYLRTFVFFKIPPREITISSGFEGCGSGSNSLFSVQGRFLTEKRTFSAHLVVFLYAYFDPFDNAIAAAANCEMKPREGATIATIRLNLARIQYGEAKDSRIVQRSELTTVVHEILHTLSFHNKIFSGFLDKVDKKSPHLLAMKNSVESPMLQDNHWSPTYLAFDLMNFSDRPFAVLSIFSLEYISASNSLLSTQAEHTPNHQIPDSIQNFSDFFSYRCPVDAPVAAYPNWCTPMEKQKNGGMKCSPDFRYITTCGTKLFQNNCYERMAYTYGLCTDEFEQDQVKKSGYFGANSRCFEFSSGGGASCLRFDINDKRQIVIGEIEQKQAVCTRPGEDVEVMIPYSSSFIKIKVRCPDNEFFIEKLSTSSCVEECHNNGFCVGGRCHCFEGYDVADNCKHRKLNALGSRFGTSYPIPKL